MDIRHPLAGHGYFKKIYFYTLFHTYLESSRCSQQLALLAQPNSVTWSWGRAQVTVPQILVTVSTAAHVLRHQGRAREGAERDGHVLHWHILQSMLTQAA